jgi:hypothetical protein
LQPLGERQHRARGGSTHQRIEGFRPIREHGAGTVRLTSRGT